MPAKNTDRLAEKHVVAVWSRPKGVIPEFVYHYTDAAGLHGVLSSRRIWATDCRFLNDETESELGIQRAKGILQSQYLKEKSGAERRIYLAFLEAMRRTRSERNFIFSLSARKDDLSQWRAYARDGRGFTIGFRAEDLLSYSEEAETYGFSKVSYSQHDFDRRCRRYIKLMHEAVTSSDLSGDKHNDYLKRAATNLEWMVYSASALYKHSSFQAEREWRVNTYKDSKHIKVRASVDSLIPYVAMPLCDEAKGCIPVAQIGIGPGFRKSNTRFALERLCESSGIEADIYVAETPFRRL